MDLHEYMQRDIMRDIAKGRYTAAKVEDIFRKAIVAACESTERAVFEYCALMFLQELHYEFGFGQKRLERFIAGFSEKARAFDAGAFDIDDMRNAIAEDTGVSVRMEWS